MAEPALDTLTEIAATLALHRLLADYCAELDASGGLSAIRFLTSDCRMDVGNMQLSGHVEIERFYNDFAQQVTALSATGVRTTRHVVTNLRIDFFTRDEARIDALMLNFSAMGSPPVCGGTIPTVVSEVHLGCRRKANEAWRIFEFTGAVIFTGDDPLQNRVLVKD